MSKLRHILASMLLLCGLTASGQRYERVVKDNFWNASGNVTGIRQDSVSRSYAEAYGQYEDGDFRDTWQASKGWSAGAATASIRHLERISLKGSFSFEQIEGYGMCGSMFIDPGFYPVDVLEFTPGRKTLQRYTFDGGFSYDVSENWRIGAAMDHRFESCWVHHKPLTSFALLAVAFLCPDFSSILWFLNRMSRVLASMKEA